MKYSAQVRCSSALLKYHGQVLCSSWSFLG